MKPSDFLMHPYDSIYHKREPETIARNIMVILSRNGDEWRLLEWDEYKTERLKDGEFNDSEKKWFDEVKANCFSEDDAKAFSPAWT